jgi:hypothetical protein
MPPVSSTDSPSLRAGNVNGRIPVRVAELLALSDERDAWQRRVLGAWRDGYQAGHAAGYERGYHRGARLLEAEWPVVVASVTACGPSFAELERRRWGPGGRERFGDPRPGDYPGRRHE